MGRILVIEDEPATQLLLQSRLRDLGHDVAVKATGAQGITEAKVSAFDLYLVDMHLGEGVDGIEVCRRLKRDPDTRNVPVVMISGRIQNRSDLHRGYEAGCEAFLNKNDMTLVEDVIRAMLRIKSLGDELSSQMALMQQRNERLQEALQDKAELEDALARSAATGGAVPTNGGGISPDGVVLVDPDGTVSYADRGARELFAKRLEGRSLGSLAPGTRLEAVVRDAKTTRHRGFRFTLSARGSRPPQNVVVAVHPLVPSAIGAESEMNVVLFYEERRQQALWDRLGAADAGVALADVGGLIELARVEYAPTRLVSGAASSGRVRKQVEGLLDSDRAVLVVGEPGVGKCFVARTLHFGGQRSGALVPVSVAALGRDRIEAELFGEDERPALLLQAQGGSLFLETPSVMPHAVQERLAEAIESGSVQLGGEKSTRTLDVRLLLAGPQSEVGQLSPKLAQLVARSTIEIAPLRERTEDVRPLTRSFLARHSLSHAPRDLTPEAWAALEAYDWPGNVRELESVIAQGCAKVLADGSDGTPIDVGDLPSPLPDLGGRVDRGHVTPTQRPSSPVPGTHQPDPSPGLPESLRSLLDEVVAALPDVEEGTIPASFDFFEKWALHLALHRSDGDKLAAAKLLSVGKSTLYRKLHKYEIR